MYHVPLKEQKPPKPIKNNNHISQKVLHAPSKDFRTPPKYCKDFKYVDFLESLFSFYFWIDRTKRITHVEMHKGVYVYLDFEILLSLLCIFVYVSLK